jgi:nucleoside-diphosphate-sugar epimerase
VALLESGISGPVNIASGNPIALKDVVNTIADKLNKRELVELEENSSASNEPSPLVADITRLKCEIGWRPAYDLNQGLEHTIDWWKNQRDVI